MTIHFETIVLIFQYLTISYCIRNEMHQDLRVDEMYTPSFREVKIEERT